VLLAEFSASLQISIATLMFGSFIQFYFGGEMGRDIEDIMAQ